MGNDEARGRWVKPPIWVGVMGAVVALLVTLASPLFAHQAMQQLREFLTESGKYLLYAAGFFVVFWVLLDPVLKNRRLSRFRWPKAPQVFREGIFSVCTQVTFIAIDIWVMFLVPQSDANSYQNISDHGWPYYLLTLLLVFILHDTYFYWMHRLVHHPMLFNRVHRVHHESTDPTPFTAFHFHPLEAAAEGAASIFLLTLFVTMPWHESVPYVWAYGQLTFNVIGHLGYEIYPAWWNKVPIMKWKTTGLHHYMHHQMIRGNYSLYFRWWDMLCGTEFPSYISRYEAVFNRAGLAGEGAHNHSRVKSRSAITES